MKVKQLQPISVEASGNKISIHADNLDGGMPWQVIYSSPATIVLTGLVQGRSYKGSDDGFFVLNQQNFKMFFSGLSVTAFTGALSIEVESDLKTIYFRSGKVIFASSSLIDDRLGEICYRHSLISLQDLLNSTVKVDEKIKFGQVLLQDQVMSNIGISMALKKQVGEIIKSLFFADQLLLHVQHGVSPATEVIFIRGEDDFIDDCYSYGVVFRKFLEALLPETYIKMIDADNLVKAFPESTFLGDILSLVSQYPKVEDLLAHLNLSRTYGLNALFSLHINGHISLEPLKEITQASDEINEALNEKIHTYELFVKYVKDHFEEQKTVFPISEVRNFIGHLNSDTIPLIMIDERGYFTKEAVSRMQALAKAMPHKLDYFKVRIDSMMRFVMQISQDNLSIDLVKLVKGYYFDIIF